jgi:hypothetical protein
MPLRRTKRSDGRHRPRWKDGSHAKVENTDAEQSRCDGLAIESNTRGEPLVRVQSLLELNDELNVSTRDRPARAGADARIGGSAAKGEVRLALQPYGRQFKRGTTSAPPILGVLTSRPEGARFGKSPKYAIDSAFPDPKTNTTHHSRMLRSAEGTPLCSCVILD